MAENQFTTGTEGGKGQTPFPEGAIIHCESCGKIDKARPDKKICWPCKRMQVQKEEEKAARQELIEENTRAEDLIDLFHQTTVSLNSFCELLDSADDEYLKIWAVLQPLIERQQEDLEKIEAVIADTLGKIQVLICTGPMSVDGKSYGTEDFYQAVLGPKKARGGAGQLQ